MLPVGRLFGAKAGVHLAEWEQGNPGPSGSETSGWWWVIFLIPRVRASRLVLGLCLQY
jgi:hypothetical protein